MASAANRVRQYEFQEALEAAVFVVEASRFEQQSLWERFAKEAAGAVKTRGDERRIDWHDQTRGWLETVGHLDKRPVCISICVSVLNGHPVLFYEATSEVVDWKLIEAWFRERCWPKWDSGTRRAHCDAMNFHHCLHVIEEIGK